MDVSAVLSATLSPDTQTRTAAEQQLNQAAEADFVSFLIAHLLVSADIALVWISDDPRPRACRRPRASSSPCSRWSCAQELLFGPRIYQIT